MNARIHGMGGHQSAAMMKDEWLTPPHILKALAAFDLDPCAPISRPWDMAFQHFTILDDGLSRAWRGRVWLNPPYGLLAGRWLERLADHGDGVALIFARTETEMFFTQVWEKADALLFLRGRLFFCDTTGTPAKANAGAPSVLIAYGACNAACLEHCGLGGHFVRLK